MTPERLDRENMGFGEVEHVHVVANARAIGRPVVIAVQVEMISSAQGDVEGKRYEVNFGIVSSGCATVPPAALKYRKDAARIRLGLR